MKNLRGNLLLLSFYGAILLFWLAPGLLFAKKPVNWPKPLNESQLNEKHFPFVVVSDESHKITLLFNGLKELSIRLKLIENAKKSILFETFIFNADKSGRLLLQALIKKAQSGVKVCLLVDGYSANNASKSLLRAAAFSGVKIRLYNPKFLLMHPHGAKWRNHRKYLSADGKKAIVSGRNTSDEYFNLSSSYNFQDCGVLIEGPIIKDTDRIFTAFFNHSYSRLLKTATGNSDFKKLLYLNNEDKNFELFLKKISQCCEETSAITNQLTIISDKPGRGPSRRILHDTIWGKIAAVKKAISIVSPNFVIFDRGARSVLHRLLNANKKVFVCTDCNTKPECSYLSRLLKCTTGQQAKYWRKKGMNFSFFDNLKYDFSNNKKGTTQPVDFPTVLPAASKLHAKIIVFDHKELMIGSYNFDPQSRRYSAEMGVFIKDCPELAARIESALKQEAKLSESEFRKKSFKYIASWLEVTILRALY